MVPKDRSSLHGETLRFSAVLCIPSHVRGPLTFCTTSYKNWDIRSQFLIVVLYITLLTAAFLLPQTNVWNSINTLFGVQSPRWSKLLKICKKLLSLGNDTTVEVIARLELVAGKYLTGYSYGAMATVVPHGSVARLCQQLDENLLWHGNCLADSRILSHWRGLSQGEVMDGHSQLKLSWLHPIDF